MAPDMEGLGRLGRGHLFTRISRDQLYGHTGLGICVIHCRVESRKNGSEAF